MAQATSVSLGESPASLAPTVSENLTPEELNSSAQGCSQQLSVDVVPDPSAPKGAGGFNYQAQTNFEATPSGVGSSTNPNGLDATDTSKLLVAQAAPDDCCEIGGTATCEVAGLPPQGGGALISPLALLGAAPLAGLAFLGSGDPKPVPVSEPSETAGLVAGFGLVGLLLSRRFRAK
ncbi:MAG TPA: hypothetical protein V6D19_14835 [Stenomitos sp.]